MKYFNIKLNIHKIAYIFTICLILTLCIFIISLFINNKSITMTNDNYTYILKDAHENISKYVGKNVTTSGYIFRGKDFPDNRFVIARDMLINDSEANIVGFLCEYNIAEDFDDNVWVEAYGTIVLGNYYGNIPIIKITTIKRITTPNDTFVYPPQ